MSHSRGFDGAPDHAGRATSPSVASAGVLGEGDSNPQVIAQIPLCIAGRNQRELGDGESSGVRDVVDQMRIDPGGGDPQPLERGRQGSGDSLRLASAGNSLVEVTCDHERPRLPIEDRRQSSQVPSVILPGCAILPARTHVGTGPGDTDTGDADRPQRRVGRRRHPSPRRKRRRACITDVRPRIPRPQQHFPAAGTRHSVAPVERGGDQMPARRKDIRLGLSEDDDVRVAVCDHARHPPPTSGAAVRPPRVPGEQAQARRLVGHPNRLSRSAQPRRIVSRGVRGADGPVGRGRRRGRP